MIATYSVDKVLLCCSQRLSELLEGGQDLEGKRGVRICA